MEKLLNEREMAERVNCSERHLRKLRKSGVLPHVRLGSLVRYDEEQVAEALAQFAVPARRQGAGGAGSPTEEAKTGQA